MTRTDERQPLDVDSAVRTRYSAGATAVVPELCCPVSYDRRYLEVIPAEVVERDYGCGDPSRHLREGETVLDLGSGTGKICFIAAQVVGASGKVVGIDTNAEMLAVARRAAPVVAERVGFANVTFLEGRIEDLAFDPAALDARLAARPVTSAAGALELAAEIDEQRRRRPLVADGSVDVVVSNCVLNLVQSGKKRALFGEIFRVLRAGGRAVISDIVCDEDVPQRMRDDPELWSGCISGALREDEFLREFERAGFQGIAILERGEAPWRTVEGIEFRSLTVQAWKVEQGPCLEQHHAVIYKGPWKAVVDDDGHTLRRGERMAVCGRTYRTLTSGPYAGETFGVEPRLAVDEARARPFSCDGRVRSPRETKGEAFRLTIEAAPCCEPGSCC